MLTDAVLRSAVAPVSAGAGRARGFTLVELLVGISILGLVLAMAAPGFADAIRNSYIRSMAESIQNGIQFARAEAVRRNMPVAFHLVNRLGATCSLSTTGTSWIVNLSSGGSLVSPAGTACGSAIDDSTTPFFVQTSANSATSSASSNSSVSVTPSGTTSIAFDGLGQLTASTTPVTTNIARTTISVQSPSATCLGTSGGTARCLNIVVDPGGQVRLCDPSISTSTAASVAC